MDEKIRYQFIFRKEVSIGTLESALEYFERNRIDCVTMGSSNEIIIDVLMTERQYLLFYSEYDWAIRWYNRINKNTDHVYVRELIRDEYLE